ncbi:MAG TPA: hypothetical protein VN831_04865 [Bradyrhizobium sp.]|nr:hypothetical protein [Bradyrhizobium sp.]
MDGVGDGEILAHSGALLIAPTEIDIGNLSANAISRRFIVTPLMSFRSSRLAALGNSSISKALIQFNWFL